MSVITGQRAEPIRTESVESARTMRRHEACNLLQKLEFWICAEWACWPMACCHLARTIGKLLTGSCQLWCQLDIKIVGDALTCGDGAPGGIRTPNLLIRRVLHVRY